MGKNKFEMIEGELKKVSIRYKVVTPERESIMGYHEFLSLNIRKKLRLKYEKNKLFKPLPHSFGIFVFNNFDNANNFANALFDQMGYLDIIKVKAIGNPSRLNFVLDESGLEYLILKGGILKARKIWCTPSGTLIYKEGVIPIE